MAALRVSLAYEPKCPIFSLHVKAVVFLLFSFALKDSSMTVCALYFSSPWTPILRLFSPYPLLRTRSPSFVGMVLHNPLSPLHKIILVSGSTFLIFGELPHSPLLTIFSNVLSTFFLSSPIYVSPYGFCLLTLQKHMPIDATVFFQLCSFPPLDEEEQRGFSIYSGDLC